MTPLCALLVDDEAPARAELRYLLSAHAEEIEVVGEAASVREALALASRLEYDVVFLDIDMPDRTGMDAAAALLDWDPRPLVVFVTAHDDHAIQAFSVDAVDYLLKPVEEQRLAHAVRRLVALAEGSEARRSKGPELGKLLVVRRGEAQLLDHADVLFAEADGDNCWIHTTGSERLASTLSMRELEDALPSTIFFRIHRSVIVNLRHVGSLETTTPGHTGVRLDDEAATTLEVARRQTRALKQHLGLR